MTENPYWDAVSSRVQNTSFFWDGPGVPIWPDDLVGGDWSTVLDRREFVKRYSWTIPDPASLAFVAGHAHGGLVDPMAGTGYWAWLLRQLKVEVDCYDLEPGQNTWHDEEVLYVDVKQADVADSVAKHPERTLLLAWPPYSQDVGARALMAYQGQRVIYIGEGLDGCCGEEEMFDQLYEHWREVEEHVPVRWFGLHDYITVYERKSSD